MLLMNPCDALMAKVLQTNADAQCDKLATELSRQCLQRSTFLSYLSKVANFNLPHLQLVPPLGVTPFEFCQDLWYQKTRVPGILCGIVCVILHLAVSVEHQLVTNRHISR